MPGASHVRCPGSPRRAMPWLRKRHHTGASPMPCTSQREAPEKKRSPHGDDEGGRKARRRRSS
eukprot:9429888-Alexandrium_andersonii.AAC.1